jgi:hypothetical protein
LQNFLPSSSGTGSSFRLHPHKLPGKLYFFTGGMDGFSQVFER